MAEQVIRREGKMTTNVNKDDLSQWKATEALTSSNKGFCLLKRMGWSEDTGLGRHAEGRHLPVLVGGHEGPVGLGYSEDNPTIRKDMLTQKLEKFATGVIADEELVFTSELSKEERARVHKMCLRLHLVSKSFGKGASRYITVRRRKK